MSSNNITHIEKPGFRTSTEAREEDGYLATNATFSVSGKIVESRDLLYDHVGLQRMKDSYLVAGLETSPQERLWYVSHKFADNKEHALRLYEYASRHWLSFASPLLSYYEEGDKHALPISCYLVYAHDSVEGLLTASAETSQLSVMGGGVSVKLGLRENSIPHIRHYDAAMLAYKQSTRRGAFCIYMDVDHPDIEAFIDIRKPTGDENLRAKNIHHAVNISDAFMRLVVKSIEDSDFDDSWDLVSPKRNKDGSKRVVSTVSARYLFAKIITTRLQTGEPFLCFIDTCNRDMNPLQKAKGLRINQSNLCTEVIVPTDKTRSSMCCLSSFNLVYFAEMTADIRIFNKFVEDVMRMLDNALIVFESRIRNNKFVQRMMGAVQGERNIGLGVMGFHSYLQQNGIAMDDLDRSLPVNDYIFKTIKTAADAANQRLGAERGSPLDIKESGMRFAYTVAVAPTATSSIIMGNTSPGIEPYYANAYTQNTLSGLSNVAKNPNLQKLLESKGLKPGRIDKIWREIISDEGSVQKVSSCFLTEYEKRMYRTFDEVDQEALIVLAANRQRYIDQGQSLTIKIKSGDADIDKICGLHVKMWLYNLKTAYYCRSSKAARADNLNTASRETGDSSCTSCEA